MEIYNCWLQNSIIAHDRTILLLMTEKILWWQNNIIDRVRTAAATKAPDRTIEEQVVVSVLIIIN